MKTLSNDLLQTATQKRCAGRNPSGSGPREGTQDISRKRPPYAGSQTSWLTFPLPDAKAWLTKALHDLGVARLAVNAPTPFLDVAIYHCQQVAEKAIKGFLVHHCRPLEKTHDLEVLVDLAADIEPSLPGSATQTPLSLPNRSGMNLTKRFNTKIKGSG